jgi:hypothetical protein
VGIVATPIVFQKIWFNFDFPSSLPSIQPAEIAEVAGRFQKGYCINDSAGLLFSIEKRNTIEDQVKI